MEELNLYVLRSHIRKLLQSCDTALSQLEFLNIYMGRLSTMLTNWAGTGHIVGGLQLVQRQIVVQGLIDMYTVYCYSKQAESDTLLSQFDDDRSDSDDDDEFIISDDHHVPVLDIGRMFSYDFCQFQRGC